MHNNSKHVSHCKTAAHNAFVVFLPAQQPFRWDCGSHVQCRELIPSETRMQGSMTPSLLCCQSGNIDDCGVCDGDGSACQKAGVVSIATIPSPTTRKLSQSSSIDAQERGFSLEHQAGNTQLESIQTIPAYHARGVLSVWVGSEYNDVVSEFQLCICTSLRHLQAFRMAALDLSWCL